MSRYQMVLGSLALLLLAAKAFLLYLAYQGSYRVEREARARQEQRRRLVAAEDEATLAARRDEADALARETVMAVTQSRRRGRA